MITTLITTILCISIILNVLLYLIYKKMNQENTVKNQYIIEITKTIEYVDLKLKEVDLRGSFSSDDEVGFVFKEIQKLIRLLNIYNYNHNESTTEEITDNKK